MTFADFNLLPSLQSSLLAQEFTRPTEIQARAIPELLGGQSVVGVAETGSGKTLSYALPILHLLKSRENDGNPVDTPAEPRAWVVVPSRELGEQVARVFKGFTHDTRLRVRTVLGGAKMELATRNVSGPFEVLVATPGRLIQLMEKKIISLAAVRILVLDEADQLLDQGFVNDIHKMVAACPSKRQLALFSATVPPPVEKLIAKIFSHPVVIRSKGSHHVVATLKTINRNVIGGNRFALLQEILAQGKQGSTILFVNTREQCDVLAAQLQEGGWRFAMYRGEMDKNERRANLKEFREGTVDLLISTDLASRGLDVDKVSRVINYHLPQQMQNYLHRVGRTARAGRDGQVINFVTVRDRPLVAQLEKVKAPKR